MQCPEFTHTNEALIKGLTAFHKLNKIDINDITLNEFRILKYVQYSHLQNSIQYCMKQLECELVSEEINFHNLLTNLDTIVAKIKD